MGVLQKRRGFLVENYDENMVFFDNPSFDSAIIGVTHDNRAVYDYDKMVESLTNEYVSEGKEEEEAASMAMEWINYNSLRALPYVPNGPIVLFNTEEMFDDEDESDGDNSIQQD